MSAIAVPDGLPDMCNRYVDGLAAGSVASQTDYSLLATSLNAHGCVRS